MRKLRHTEARMSQAPERDLDPSRAPESMVSSAAWSILTAESKTTGWASGDCAFSEQSRYLRSPVFKRTLQTQGGASRLGRLHRLTEFSMLRSIPSSKKAASVHTLWMEDTTVPLEAGTPKINVQMESRSNCRDQSEGRLAVVSLFQRESLTSSNILKTSWTLMRFFSKWSMMER